MSLPSTVYIENKPYCRILLKVKSRYPDGRPKDLQLIPDEREVELDEHTYNDFITSFVLQTTCDGTGYTQRIQQERWGLTEKGKGFDCE